MWGSSEDAVSQLCQPLLEQIKYRPCCTVQAAVLAQPLILGRYPWLGLAKIKARSATASAEQPGLYSWGQEQVTASAVWKEKGTSNTSAPTHYTFALCRALALHKSPLKRAKK